MEWRRRGIGSPALVIACTVLTMIPKASSVRYLVGGSTGWSNQSNLTAWAQGKHFNTEDWLFFVYDRNQYSVLQVNQTNYESCNSNSFLHNYTGGAGRDVAPLNKTGPFYFISGNGFCYRGVKIAMNVTNLPPPPSASPARSNPPPPPSASPVGSNLPPPPSASPVGSNLPPPPSASPVGSNLPPPPSASPVGSNCGFLMYTIRGQIFIPAVFAIAAVRGSLLRVR